MALKNPNKPIRIKYISLLTGLGVPIADKQLPPSDTIPPLYILIQSQTKREKDRNKCDKNWDCTTSVDIYYRAARGFIDSAVVDDLEDSITQIIAPSVQFDIDLSPDFKVYNTFVESPTDIPVQTPNETILHRVLRFRHIIGEKY